jgi:two-component system sensor kinase FixL
MAGILAAPASVAAWFALVLFLLGAMTAAVVAERRRRRAEAENAILKRAEAEAQRALHDLAHLNLRAGMEEVVSAVTHELTQSLTASLSNAQALKRLLAERRVNFDELPAIVDDISDANRQASEIISRIRSLMRKEDFDLRALDLNTIVMDVVQVLYSTAANDGVALVADLGRDMPPVMGDRIQIRQVVMNLVLNAVQATRGHQCASPMVRVVTLAENGNVLVRVDDAGPGIADEVRPRLFEPYFTTKTDGLGVGLSISRSIVNSHGGSIATENLPRGGARFSVTFPAA